MSELDEDEYEQLAYPELEKLVRALDGLESEAFECELAHDILSIEFSDGSKYVINSHRAARQIWMAAERSAWHFDWSAADARWIARKTGDELWQTLSRTLGDKLGHSIALRSE